MVFAVDVTASMPNQLEILRSRLPPLLNMLSLHGIDWRVALIGFDDDLRYVQSFSRNTDEIVATLSGWTADGGGDARENALEALYQALLFSYRPFSQKWCVLVTDADYHELEESGNGKTSFTTDRIISLYQERQASVVIAGPALEKFRRLAQETDGFYYPIQSLTTVFDTFSDVLTLQTVLELTSSVSDTSKVNHTITVRMDDEDAVSDHFHYTLGVPAQPVHDLQAIALSPDSILCRWRWIDASHSGGITLVRHPSLPAEQPEEGVIVYEGSGLSFIDDTVVADQSYTYTAFAFNEQGRYVALDQAAHASCSTWPVQGYKTVWEKQILTPNTLNTVTAIDSSHVWIAGDGGAFFQKEQSSWTGRQLSFRYQLMDLMFIDPNRGWMVGKEGSDDYLLFNSQNSGRQWSSTPYDLTNQLERLFFLTDSTGYAVGGKGLIQKTLDGGANWIDCYRNDQYHFKAVHFLDTQTGWVAGSEGLITKTTDGGRQWILQSGGINSTILDLTFIDYQTGWAVSEDGEVLMTTNGGQTWTGSRLTYQSLNAIDFFDSNHGVVVGNSGVCFETRNGGGRWVRCDLETDVDLNDVCLLSPLNGWMVGANGTLFERRRYLSNTTRTGLEVFIRNLDTERFPQLRTVLSVFDSEHQTPVRSLDVSNFTLRENGRVQSLDAVNHFKGEHADPVDIILLIDQNVLVGHFESLQSGLEDFDANLNLADIPSRFTSVVFSHRIEALYPFENSPEAMAHALFSFREPGGAYTSDPVGALTRALSLPIEKSHETILLLITDAIIKDSSTGLDSLLTALEHKPVTVFVSAPQNQVYRWMTGRTGGLMMGDQSPVTGVFDTVSDWILSQYVIYSQSEADMDSSQRRLVDVTVESNDKGGYAAGEFETHVPSLSALPSRILALPNQHFTVDLRVEYISNSTGLDLSIHYDSTRIAPVRVAEGDFYQQGGASATFTTHHRPEEQVLDLSITRFNTNTGANGSGRICSVVFEPLHSNCDGYITVSEIQIRRLFDSNLNLEPLDLEIVSAANHGVSGDLDGDFDIDIRDFSLLSTYWKPSNDPRGDIGPATGELPFLKTLPDGVVGYEDLFVFARMWSWYHDHPVKRIGDVEPVSLSWRETILEDSSFCIELVADQMQAVAMGHLDISMETSGTCLPSVEYGELFADDSEDWVRLTETDSEEGQVSLTFSQLGVGNSVNRRVDKSLLRFIWHERPPQNCRLKWHGVDIRTLDQRPVMAAGKREWTPTSDPEPGHTAMKPAVPNPFNTETIVSFSLAQSGWAMIRVYNLKGQHVRTLYDQHLSAGNHRCRWDGRDQNGIVLGSGLYFVVLTTDQQHSIRRVLFIK
jgi:photosystem II stability/assembly factor-like uncharacterized protein